MKKVFEALRSIDRKLLIYLGAVVVIAIIAIIFSIVMYKIKNSNLSYTEVEKRLVSAAKDYYKENSNLLPKKDGGEVIIRDSKLSDEGYMKPMSKLIKDGSCKGKVVVTLNEKKYRYVAYLDCGKEYQTKEMYKKIIESGTVNEKEGLYKLDNEYIFRGEKVNNYLKFDNKIFRIMKVNSDNTIQIIYEEDYRERSYNWDNRYNADIKNSYGYNTYEKSRLKETLDEIYNTDLFFTSKKYKAMLSPMTVCIGSRSENESRGKEADCAATLADQYVTTLTAYEYMQASIDEKCTYTTAKSCVNYNYLRVPFSFWTITPNSENTYSVYMISKWLISTETNDSNSIRPIVTLSADIMYAKGNGTENSPYEIR